MIQSLLVLMTTALVSMNGVYTAVADAYMWDYEGYEWDYEEYEHLPEFNFNDYEVAFDEKDAIFYSVLPAVPDVGEMLGLEKVDEVMLDSYMSVIYENADFGEIELSRCLRAFDALGYEIIYSEAEFGDENKISIAVSNEDFLIFIDNYEYDIENDKPYIEIFITPISNGLTESYVQE